MRRSKTKSLSWSVICITGLWFLFAANAMADDDHGFRRHFEREDRHRIPFWGSDDEGSETVGQVAAWLLLVANLPVALSLLVKGTNRFAPLRNESKKTLANLNRMQKKALMWLHYYLNLAILVIAIGHWLSSRCKSSALPELGLMMMVAVIALGFLLKFKLCPKALRTYAYRVHTQPFVFIVIFMVLTVGHLIVD